MSLERAALQGKLAEAKNREQRLTQRIEGLAAALRLGLNTALTPAADLEVPQLAEQWDQLVTAWGELQATRAELARLARELR